MNSSANHDWPSVKLGEVLSPHFERVELDPTEHYKQITVKLWGKGVVQRDEVLGSSIGAKRYKVKAGRFILSQIDARNGAFGIVPDDLDGAVVSRDFPTFDFDHSRLLPDYLGWLSKTEPFVELCRADSKGSTNRVRLKAEDFLQLEIPLPPLAEQQRLVERIDALAAKVEEAQRLREEATEETDQLVSSTNVWAAGDRSVKLGEIMRLDEDRAEILPTDSYPQVGIRAYGKGLFTKEATHGSDTSYRYFNRLYEGAVVLSQPKGWEGAIAVCDAELEGWFTSPEYRTLRCIPDEASPRYLRFLFKTPWFWKQLENLTRGIGARRQRLRPEQFLELELPLPTRAQQEQAVKGFHKISELSELRTQTTEELDTLLPAVLDQAFRGML